MNKCTLAFSIFIAVGTSHAVTLPCEGFKMIVSNKMSQEIMMQKAEIQGALLNKGSSSLPAKAEQNFTVSDTQEKGAMHGELTYTTPDLQKNIKITFTLENKKTMCEFNNLQTTGNLTLIQTRLLNGIEYVISDR